LPGTATITGSKRAGGERMSQTAISVLITICRLETAGRTDSQTAYQGNTGDSGFSQIALENTTPSSGLKAR